MTHRDKLEQYQWDRLALRVCKEILADRHEFDGYFLIEKLFIVFPLMQSENVEDAMTLILKLIEFLQYAQTKGYKDVADTLKIILE